VPALLLGCSLDQFRRDPPPRVAPGDECRRLALIEDSEDRDDRILLRQGRSGYLYTFVDAAGSRISPGASDMRPEPGGPPGSRRALHVKGQLAPAGQTYAGLALDLLDPRGPYDAARYRGVAFAARSQPGAAPHLRFRVPDVNTDPDGKACSECYNDFGIAVELTEQWTRYEIDFTELRQESGWGAPRPPAIDPHALMSLQWQVTAAGSRFDFWVDDITFLGCP
jgi:hypothetical protein